MAKEFTLAEALAPAPAATPTKIPSRAEWEDRNPGGDYDAAMKGRGQKPAMTAQAVAPQEFTLEEALASATPAPVAPAPVAPAPVAPAPVARAPVAQSQAPVAQAPVAQAPAPVAQAPVAPVARAPVAQAQAPAPASGGFFDSLGTGMNAVRDWSTGANKPKGSVLESLRGPVVAAPVPEDKMLNPEFVQKVEAKLNAMPKDQRAAELAKMLKRPDVYGRAAKVVAARYAMLDKVASPTAQNFDPRLEAQKARFEKQGRPADLAELDAKYQALSGGLRPDFDQMTEAAPEYAEAAPYQVQGNLTGIAQAGQTLLRGGIKGGLAYEQGVRGINLFVGDALGFDTSTNRARLDSINRFTEAMGEQSSKPLNLLEGAITSIGQQAPALIGGALTGSQVAVLGAMYAQSFGQTYDEGKRKKLDPVDNVARSAMYAAFEVLGEKFGLGDKIKAIKAAANGMPSDKIAGFFAKSLAKEVPGEELTYAGQFAVDKGYGMNPEAGIADFISGAVDTALSTVIQTGLMAGAGVAAGKGVNKVQELRDKIQAGQRQGYKQDTSTDGLAELMARSRGFLTPEARAAAPVATEDFGLGDIGTATPGEGTTAATDIGEMGGFDNTPIDLTNLDYEPHATAAQRAEAFLRTLGLLKDES